ncbi:hypothetical protein [Okeania sp. KiyG1]|uniref:hypothetical protein n=1 Tax=Okeania sp. KiyG1 TaxID=2720165 RepID=UPI001924FC9B|nr:hypothetical protein [Okeania sp. KiyG1]GGA57865.1 hypothetical protein CYANOKiyG1_78990 [Okeania sp. KiyG1]
MNSTKTIVWKIPVLLFMLIGVTTACIPKTYNDLSCDVPSAAGQSPSLDTPPEQINISLNIDGSESMPGYLANGGSRYVKTIELLERTFFISNSPDLVKYYRVGGPEKQNIDRSKFLEAKTEIFYREDRVTSNLAGTIIPQREGKELLVLISDLYQNQGDVTALNQKIREHYLNKEGYAAAILAIRSEFNGTVYVVGSNREDFNFLYNTEGKAIEEFRPFYVVFLGPYEHILYYFNKLKRDGGELMKNSEFTIFSPSNIVNDLSVIGELTNPDKAIPGLRRPFSLNNGKVAIELPTSQPIELLEINRNFQEEIAINYKVSLPILNQYTLPPSANSIQAKISESKFFDESTKELISPSKESTISTKLSKSMQFSDWKPDEKNRELSFKTTIKPSELPQPNIYFFQVDLIANGLGEQDWWQNWNCEDRACENDGSKTHNLEHFLLGLKSITTDLMENNPIKFARLCYAIQKN